MIFGQHVAFTEKKTRVDSAIGMEWKMFCHCPESWEKLWTEKVFAGESGKVKVDAKLINVNSDEARNWTGLPREDYWVMNWSVTRL